MVLRPGLLPAEVAWRCCWPPAPAASSLQALWPRPVPAGMPGSAPSPSSCLPPAQRHGWHQGAPVGPAATAASGWRAVRGSPGSVARARPGLCWLPAQGWRPSAVPVMVEGQVLGWGLAPRLQGMLQVLRRKAWEQEARLALSVGLLLLPVALSLVVLGPELCLRSELPPVPPATPKAALPATGAAARFGAVVARCRAVAPAIAASGPGRWPWQGRAVARGTGATRW